MMANIIPNGTTVKILINEEYVYGTIEGNNLDNSRENSKDLNYYIVPNGKTMNEEITVLWSEVELTLDCPNCGQHFEEKLDIKKDNLGIYVNCPECSSSFDL